MLILGAEEIRRTLDGAETELIAAVAQAYTLHARGRTAVPHSVFLRFPRDERNRIIALPAYLGRDEPVAGVKWVSSFPGNVAAGKERASAALLLNSMADGRPEALLEGSLISARRTAASAALAAATLRAATPETGVSLIGTGPINFEVLRFLCTALPELGQVTVFDLDRTRARAFVDRCVAAWPDLKAVVAETPQEALAAHRLISIATTASKPHLSTDACRPGSLVLHVSLRDIEVPSILDAVNVVDDADHVCRESTSLHLAECFTADRSFIAAALGDILAAGEPWLRDEEQITVFSPFGLGILDLAVADLARRRARELGIGTTLQGFLPTGD